MSLKHFFTQVLFLVSIGLGAQNLAGTWNGLLDVHGKKLRVQFILEENTSGWKARMLSPDQTSQEFECDLVSISEDSVIMTMSKINISFKGERVAEDVALNGNLFQGDNVNPLLLSKTEISKPIRERSQNPKEPFPYTIEEVTFENKESGITLSGTLSMPSGKGPFPAVVLISGSGPQDRDETMLDHKPFWVIADYLTRQGFAVLRYDDRGIGKSKGNFAIADSRDFAWDALAALNFLETKKFIDKTKTGFAGHSEGGYIAPMAAVMSSTVDFVISLAGSGVSGQEVLHQQTIDVEIKEGLSPQQAEKDAQKNDALFAILRQYPDSAEAASAIFKYLENSQEVSAETTPNFESYKNYHNSFFNSRWLRFFAQHNPSDDWKKVNCPVLAVNGDKDLQVNADINLKAIADALEEGGNTNYKTIKYVGLNHLFQPTEHGRVSEYENIDITIDPEVLTDMGNWLKEICRMN